MDFPELLSNEEISMSLSYLGIKPENVKAVFFTPFAIEVHYYATTSDGRKFAKNANEPAVNIHCIPVAEL